MDRKEVEDTAELKVRRYFDHFLMNVYPQMLEMHVSSCPVQKQVSKVKWALIGAAVVISVAVPAFGKPLLSFLGVM